MISNVKGLCNGMHSNKSACVKLNARSTGDWGRSRLAQDPFYTEAGDGLE